MNPETRRHEGGTITFPDPKTEKSRRQVSLPEFVVTALKSHRGRQAGERLALGAAWQESGLVFTTTIGTPLDPRNVSRQFSDAARRVGLGDWHVHELRHSAASLMIAQGIPIEVVSSVLGHANIRMTVDTYGHVGPAAGKPAAAAMDDLFGSGSRGL